MKKNRQLVFLGHLLRKHGLENSVVTGKIDGRRAKVRQRLKYLDSFCAPWKNKASPAQLISASENRGLWHRRIVSPTSSTTA